MGATRWVLLALAIGLTTASPARAASVDAVTMFSDEGDTVGRGTQQIVTRATSDITVTGTTADLTVSVSGGAEDETRSLEFAAPRGQTLAPGVYDNAQRAGFADAGHPGIAIPGDAGECKVVAGRFEVKALDVTPEGHVQRLWIVYEQRCELSMFALFGEVRLGVAGGDGPAAVTSSIVRWRPLDPGVTGTAVPVRVTATAPLTIGSVAVTGAHPMDFPEYQDECSGRTLGAGDACDVWVRFVPTVPGTRTARLRIPVGDATHDVELQGYAYGGRTRAIMHSDEGDYIGQGGDWSYTRENATIDAVGTPDKVWFRVAGPDYERWLAWFVPSSGDAFVEGRTYQATRYPFNEPGPGMDIDSTGRGCDYLSGTFTVSDAHFDVDGRMRSFGVDFEQHCGNATPALRGTFEFRAGDTTPPAPWMVDGPGSTGPNVEIENPMAPPSPRAGGAAAPPADPAKAPSVTCQGVDARLVRGTPRANRLAGSRQSERIVARAGRDRVLARGGRDCVDGGAGDDVLSGGAGRDRLYGGRGADVLAGGSGRDRLLGGAGNDMLAGGAGNDMLAGGAGRDRLDCGAGHRDVARGVQRGERVTGCERVIRSR